MRVLIIDDEQSIRDLFTHLVQALGHEEIDAVASGEEALAQVIRHDYDLITLDIQMPGLSGLETIAVLRDACPHAIIAIISGHIPEDISKEVEGCADLIMPKPVGVKPFTELVRKVAEFSDTLQQIRSLGTWPHENQD